MAEERKHQYGDRPIPEGATISSTGRVWKKTQPLIPCPSCETGWMDKDSKVCGACWKPDPDRAAASMAKARAARTEQLKAAKTAKTEKATRDDRVVKAFKTAAKVAKKRPAFMGPCERAAAAIMAAPASFAQPAPINPLVAYGNALTHAAMTDAEAQIMGTAQPRPAPVPDLINHPPHYEAGGFEALPIVRALGFDFDEGSAFKYLFRHKRKGMPLDDLKKCRFFIEALIARYEGEGATP